MTLNQDVAIEVKNLRFSYDNEILIDLASLSVQRGESMAILGASGSGKTTLLHLLAGLLTPSSGSIALFGSSLTEMRETERDRFRGRHIGLVFQRLHLLPALSVLENIMLTLRLARLPPDKQRVDQLLDQLHLKDLAMCKPDRLSQGQAQRVAIARAVVHRPKLLIADEPTSALDDKNAEDAIAMLRESASGAGATLLVVTHDQRVRGSLAREFEMPVPL
ncbi:MAG: ABC-type lipoprotein export system ATPase subunit [Glaciecola sp.]|jgi:putative ABC transport system ATP-binding protein